MTKEKQHSERGGKRKYRQIGEIVGTEEVANRGGGEGGKKEKLPRK